MKRQEGTSLAELLLVVAILGFLVLMLAPTESFLLRALARNGDAPTAEVEIGNAAAFLAGDARNGTSYTVDPAHTLRIVRHDGVTVTWRHDGDHLVRSSGRSTMKFRVDRLQVDRGNPGLLQATLTAPDGRTYRTAAMLRRTEAGS